MALKRGPVELQERRRGQWVHRRYANVYRGAASLATHWHARDGGTYRVLMDGIVVRTWPDDVLAGDDDPREWTLTRKLAYVRARIKAQDSLPSAHPDKRLSLYPLTLPEALGAIFQATPPTSPALHVLEKLEWLKAQSALNHVRKFLNEPLENRDASASPVKASKQGRTSRT